MDFVIIICIIILLIIIIISLYFLFTNSEMMTPVNVEMMTHLESNSFPFPIYIINLDRKPERYEYVRNQLDNLDLNNYQRWLATDGFRTSDDEMLTFGVTLKLIERRGIAGCAASHIRLWRHLVEHKLGWTLILEDDVHFHPEFKSLFSEYWNHIPNNAKMIFPGYCCGGNYKSHDLIVETHVMCTHAYMISHVGAQYLLDKLLPISHPIDIIISDHFRDARGCYVVNGNSVINGTRPNDYKDKNGERCMFDGIIYQNQEDQGSTIHGEQTVFNIS